MSENSFWLWLTEKNKENGIAICQLFSELAGSNLKFNAVTSPGRLTPEQVGIIRESDKGFTEEIVNSYDLDVLLYYAAINKNVEQARKLFIEPIVKFKDEVIPTVPEVERGHRCHMLFYSGVGVYLTNPQPEIGLNYRKSIVEVLSQVPESAELLMGVEIPLILKARFTGNLAEKYKANGNKYVQEFIGALQYCGVESANEIYDSEMNRKHGHNILHFLNDTAMGNVFYVGSYEKAKKDIAELVGKIISDGADWYKGLVVPRGEWAIMDEGLTKSDKVKELLKKIGGHQYNSYLLEEAVKSLSDQEIIENASKAKIDKVLNFRRSPALIQAASKRGKYRVVGEDLGL